MGNFCMVSSPVCELNHIRQLTDLPRQRFSEPQARILPLRKWFITSTHWFMTLRKLVSCQQWVWDMMGWEIHDEDELRIQKPWNLCSLWIPVATPITICLQIVTQGSNHVCNEAMLWTNLSRCNGWVQGLRGHWTPRWWYLVWLIEIRWGSKNHGVSAYPPKYGQYKTDDSG